MFILIENNLSSTNKREKLGKILQNVSRSNRNSSKGDKKFK